MIVSRFAPAPTGLLHLGHVVNALYVWGLTKALGGRVLLRIEDHDRQRSRFEYERTILDDLDWLGFTPDAPPTIAFRAGRCEGRQSDREPLYESALEDLARKNLIYYCECSRKEIAGVAAPDGELWYPGTCRGKGLAAGPGLGVRVRIDVGIEAFDDLAHGIVEQRPSEQCGDVLLRDREDQWTYQFAAAVDDYRQGVTLVIRGDDLLPSTGRQIQIARLLGRDVPPRFFHHPLVMKSPTQKLSKADRDTSVGDLRNAGWSRERVIGNAAELVGLEVPLRGISAADAPGLLADRYPRVIEALLGGPATPIEPT